MSYAAFGVDAAVATPDPCVVAGGIRDTEPDGGYCHPKLGYDFLNATPGDFRMAPITSCPENQLISPRGTCECPPGTHAKLRSDLPYPEHTDECVTDSFFPNCVDAKGVRVPNCFMGREASPMLYAAAAGAALGGLIVLGVSYLKSR